MAPSGMRESSVARCASFSFAVIGVATKPGATMFTVTPRGATSCASALLIPISPALAAA